MRKIHRSMVLVPVIILILLVFSTSVSLAVWLKLGATAAGGDETVCVDGMGITLADTTNPNLSVSISNGGTLASANVTLANAPTTQNVSGVGNVTYTFSGRFFFKWLPFQVPGSSVTLTVTDVAGSLSASYVVQDCHLAEPPPANTADDRLNPDPLASAAVYCRSGGFEIWAIDSDGNGHLAIKLSRDQVAAIPIPATNTLVTQALGVRLYRLSSGQFQINANPRAPASVLNGGTTTTTSPAQTTTTVTVAAGSGTVYVVQPGDNLFRISLRFHLPMAVIAAANGITNFNLIYVGQRLIIPAGGTVVVNTVPTVSTASSSPAVAPTGPEYVFIWNGC